MAKKNIRRSEKRLRIALKTGICLAALTGAYFAAPTVCKKIEAFYQEWLTQKHIQRQAVLARRQAWEQKIRHQVDCDIICDIETIEKEGYPRESSARTVLEIFQIRNIDCYDLGDISEEECSIRYDQLYKRWNQLIQIDNNSLLKKGTHPLIDMIMQERQPVKVNEKTDVSSHNVGQEHTR